MNEHAEHAIVTGYESLIGTLEEINPKDRHVVAAAIRARADTIVTLNLKDFPAAVLARYDLEAQHPDVFIVNQLSLEPAVVCAAAKACRQRLKNPPYTVSDYLTSLERSDLPRTAALLGGTGYRDLV